MIKNFATFLKQKNNEEIKKYISCFFIFFLLFTLSFGMGWLFAIEDQKMPVTIEYDFSVLPDKGGFEEGIDFNEEISKEKGAVVGSKNGSVYHLPWCPGAKQINEENEVWFESRKEAEDNNYTPAQNCKGL